MVETKKILEPFLSFLEKESLDLFIINSTDEYLNEYVLPEDNSRYLLTGFSGSAGDVLAARDQVLLFVDGRYHIQAEKEIDPELITLIKVELGNSPKKALFKTLAELATDNSSIGIVSSKTSCAGFKELLKNLEGKQDIEIIEYEHDPIIPAGKSIAENPLSYIPQQIAGATPEQKLEIINNYKKENNIDLMLVTDLTEIAYLTNLRGREIPYSSAFRSKTVVFRDEAYVFTDISKLPRAMPDKFIFQPENKFNSFIEKLSKANNVSSVYYHPGSTTLSVFRKVEKLAEKVVEIKDSFVSELKAIKNERELQYLQECYLKTDIVVNRVSCRLNQNLERGIKVSEKDFSDKLKSLFKEEGATGLSFEPITASGTNTAIIHYSHPSPDKFIEKGELVLLDCGAYFEGGYATDQTRTFLAGEHEVPASDLQKQVYTAVLKGFLAGINLEINEDTTGYDLDLAVREVVDAGKPEGFAFSHATGHGVGIAVHESPPGIGPSESSKTPLKAGMVFTVEPGLYKEGWGGVRIENTVMAVNEDGKVKIKTLTKAPFDENLINYTMLTEQEKSRLQEYNSCKIG